MNSEDNEQLEQQSLFGSEIGGITQPTVNVTVKDQEVVPVSSEPLLITAGSQKSKKAKDKKSNSKAKAKANGDTDSLSEKEQEDFQRCEAVIDKGQITFIQVGQALDEIHDKRLYRATHTSFKKYVEERWNISRSQAYRVMAAANCVTASQEMSPTGDTLVPKNEYQARKLLKQEKERKAGKQNSPKAKKSVPSKTRTDDESQVVDSAATAENESATTTDSPSTSPAVSGPTEEERREIILQQLVAEHLVEDPETLEDLRINGLPPEDSLREDIIKTPEQLGMLRNAMRIGRSADVPPAMMNELKKIEDALVLQRLVEVIYTQFRQG